MSEKKKIKVVWICHFSNSEIRAKLKFVKWSILSLLHAILKKNVITDFAQWNTNAIKEFENYDDIELHIISPHLRISGLQEFELNGIKYHFFQSEDDNFLTLLKSKFVKNMKMNYSKNSLLINKLIKQINPDLIHMIGAENPYYGKSALTLPLDIPLVVSLQTLMSDPAFFKNYNISKENYDFRAGVEASIIRRANFIGTSIEYFRNIISENIKNNAKFLDIKLAVAEKYIANEVPKEYDFTYFAADISKAVDYALEAFALAKKRYPHITLHVVGGYEDSFMNSIQLRMNQLGLGTEVDFTGHLKTHDDVISEVCKARFALLPLKIDLISGTIREAMANRLPVISTITPATPELNKKRKSILLSEKGDFQAMAESMCLLLENENLARTLQENAAITIEEKYSNKEAMLEWKKSYFEILHM